MKLSLWVALAFAGGLAFLSLFIADRQTKSGVDRLSDISELPHSALDDPNLKHVSERSPYMRTER
jgi:hypothetical protein